MTDAYFDAIERYDAAAVTRALADGVDPAATDGFGFTALHRAAMSVDRDPARATAVIEALVAAGAPLEHPGPDGRTPLYLAAELASDPAGARALADAGADPDVRDGFGNHVLENTWSDEVRVWLAERIGVEASAPSVPPAAPDARLGRSGWREASGRIDLVFATLDAEGIVCGAAVGETQDDALADLAEVADARAAAGHPVVGVAYFTRADRARAKRSSVLPIGFGAVDGDPDASVREVGRSVAGAFEAAGFHVVWSGEPGDRVVLELGR